MDLNSFLELGGIISEINEDTFFYELFLNDNNMTVVKVFFDNNYIEQLKDEDNKIISIENLNNHLNKKIKIEFLNSEFKKIGYYHNFKDFINNNRYNIPQEYYISELETSSFVDSKNIQLEKYKAITLLISKLVEKAKFISDIHIKTICLVQEKSFIEIEIDNIIYEDYLESEDILSLNNYILDIESYKEKQTIFIKELIDFLSNKKQEDRFGELILHFKEFYKKCNTSFDYYLSNFSYNKIKLEIDNSVLEYSKNIRTIINDSQSKLVVIPAAFILGASQLDYTEPLIIKNIVIIISSFLFSYIISIFIQNQKNAIEIISDNLQNYKSNYKRSKSSQIDEEMELKSLSELINNSYSKIEKEIKKQNCRLTAFQFCNWGVSILLLVSIIYIVMLSIEWNCGSS